MPHISIVAPVYNEVAETLHKFVERIDSAVNQVSSDYEIIFVDDGSSNEAWPTIAGLAAGDPRVKGLRLSRNFGQHVAITAGLDHAAGRWVVVMDSDLQDRPEVIPEIYRKAQEGFDIVFVDRERRPETRTYRLIAATFYAIFNLLAGQSYNRRQANFSLISARVVAVLREMREPLRFYGGLIRWIGFPSASVTAEHGARFAGRPSYTPLRLFKLASRWIVGFSTRLLYVAIFIGMTMALGSLFGAVAIVWIALANPHQPVPGWASVMTSVFFTAGITNILLGLIGVYVGQLVNAGKNRPLYVIEAARNMVNATVKTVG